MNGIHRAARENLDRDRMDRWNSVRVQDAANGTD